MAVTVVRSNQEYVQNTTLSAINNGTLFFRFKSGTTGVTQDAFGVGSVVDDSSFVIIGGNISGSYADESLRFICLVGSSTILEMYVRNGQDFYNDDAWHNIAFRIDGSDNAIFIDGTKPTITFAVGASNTNNAFMPTVNSVMRLGTIGIRTNLSFDGEMDDMRIYSTGLTDNECIAMTNGSGADKIVRNLECWWRMNEATAGTSLSTASDISGNGITGTGVNTPTYIESPLRII